MEKIDPSKNPLNIKRKKSVDPIISLLSLVLLIIFYSNSNQDPYHYLLDGSHPHPAMYDFLFSFESQGFGNRSFNFPHGIAINRTGFVYITDWGNNRVEVFSPNGTYLY